MLCASCAKDHNKPIANIEFSRIEREGKAALYNIYFTSNIDILGLFRKGDNEEQIGAMLVCPLENDTNFSVDHQIERSAYGLIERTQELTEQGRFSYVSKVFLSETEDNGTTHHNLSKSTLNDIISSNEYVPCKAIVTAFLFRAYYSGTMYVPAKDILREVNR